MNPLIDEITSGINVTVCFQSKTATICSTSHPWHPGQPVPTISLVYLIMAVVEVPRQSGQVRAGRHQPAGQDVNLQMSLVLYILNARFVKLHRCHCKSGGGGF